MLWILLGISAHFFWAINNVGDKYIVGQRVKNPYVYIVWFTITGLMTLLVVPFIHFYIPPTPILLWLIVAGALYFFGGLPYIKAMQMEEPTRVSVWWNLIPVISLLIGWIFLDESFTSWQITAFVLLVAGAFTASMHARGQKIIFSKAVWHMLVSCTAFALYAIIFRYCTRYTPFTNGFVWVHLVMVFFASMLLMAKRFRLDFVQEYRLADASLISLVLVLASLAHVAAFFSQWALSLSSAALVFSLEGFQVIFVFAMAVLLSLFMPAIVKEELDLKNILLKLAALSLMIAGILVLTLA